MTFDAATTRRRWTRTLWAVAAMLPIFAGGYYCSFLLRFGGAVPSWGNHLFWVSLPWVLYAKSVALAWATIRDGWSRVVSFHDLKIILRATLAGALAIMVLDTLAVPQHSLPRSVVVVDWGITFLSLCAIRCIPRMWDESWSSFRRSANGVRVLIVGANDHGEALVREIHRNASLNYNVVGIVDDRAHRKGHVIGGVPVIGATNELAKIIEKSAAEELLIIAGEVTGKTVRSLHEHATELGVRVKVLPSYEQLLQEHVSVQPRAVVIEDLLQRDSIDLDMHAINDWLKGRTVLVTGSAGSIGSEICRQLLQLSPGRLIVVDRSETGQFFLDRELQRVAGDIPVEVIMADLTDSARLKSVFEQFSPDIVFHAAAYKHVPLMEHNPGEAVKNIVLATRNLVDVAEESGVGAFVMISTDKAVNPTSVMGSCKQLAERYVQARADGANCRFVTVRFGNVLDSAGSVVPVFREQIAQGGPITVTHPDIIRFFMLIPEAAQLVIQAGAMGQGGEIFVLDMGEPVKIVDLARDMIRLSGLREGHDIEIEFTGLRPGEKLYEELYGKGEDHRETSHPKIMVADSRRHHLLEVIRDIGLLQAHANDEPGVVVDAIRSIVPLGGQPLVEKQAA